MELVKIANSSIAFRFPFPDKIPQVFLSKANSFHGKFLRLDDYAFDLV
jgi:hypothetical protein